MTVFSLFFVYVNSVEGKMMEVNSQYNRNLLYQTSAYIEDYYESIHEIGTQIYSNDSIHKLINSNGILTWKEKEYLQDWVIQMANSSPSIYSVTLYVQKTGKIFDTNYGYSHYLDFPDSGFVVGSYSGMKNRMILTEKRTLRGSFYDASKDKEVLSMTYSLPYTNHYTNRVVINIDMASVYGDIMAKMENTSNFTFAIINQDNQIILGEQDDLVVKQLIQGDYLAYGTDKQAFNVTLNEEHYMINIIPSTLYQWNFVWIDAVSTLDETFLTLRKFIMVTTVLILLVIFIPAFYISRKATKPMDDLLNHMEADTESFHFMRQLRESIESTLTANETMNRKLEKTSDIYKQRILYSMLANNGVNMEETLTLLEGFNVSFAYRYVYVINIEIINLYELNSINADLPSVKKQIIDVVETCFDMKDMEYHTINMEPDMITILVNSDNDDYDREKQLLSYVIQQIIGTNDSLLKVKTAFGISQKSDDMNHLHTLNLQSKQALFYRDIHVNNCFTFYDDVCDSNHYTGVYEMQEAFESYLLAGNREACTDLLRQMLDDFRQSTTIMKTDFANFNMHFLSMALRVSLKSRIDIAGNSYLNGDIWRLTLSIKTIYAADNILTDIIDFICGEINSLKSYTDNVHLSSILAFIDDHYNENISMDMVSDATGISASYIYKIFKENMNQTFLEYITDKRIQKACELLQEDMKVKDIADSLGYSNAKYFNHVFKKNKGMTPNQYKKLVNF